jgi:glycerol-3-phosphate dehydrogenase (NAD(P)+)
LGKISVLGAGAWGTAIAKYLCEQGHNVEMWARDEQGVVVRNINKQHRNERYLRGIALPSSLTASTNFRAVIKGAECIVIASVSHGLRSFLIDYKDVWPRDLPVIILTKGLADSGERMSEVVISVLNLPLQQVAVLSGPNLAQLFAKGIEASTVVSSASIETEKYFAEIFHSDILRVYMNSDVIGVELGGAIKNVFAVAAGIVDALYEDEKAYERCIDVVAQALFDDEDIRQKRKIIAKKAVLALKNEQLLFATDSDNVKSALIARGLTEISRFGKKIGANESTFSGLSGVGDITVTACGQTSRNRNFGYRVGKGELPKKIVDESTSVIEGYFTVKAIGELAINFGLTMKKELPICDMVYNILYSGKNPREALGNLMSRPAQRELIVYEEATQ